MMHLTCHPNQESRSCTVDIISAPALATGAQKHPFAAFRDQKETNLADVVRNCPRNYTNDTAHLSTLSWSGRNPAQSCFPCPVVLRPSKTKRLSRVLDHNSMTSIMTWVFEQHVHRRFLQPVGVWQPCRGKLQRKDEVSR